MEHNKLYLLLKKYSKYFQYGAAILLTVWLASLLTNAIMPGPYYFDFFGVVTEKNYNTSSVSIGWEASISAFIILPLVMTAVDWFNTKKWL